MRFPLIGRLILAGALAALPGIAVGQTSGPAPASSQAPPAPPSNLAVPVPAGFDLRDGSVRPELDAAWAKLTVAEQVRLTQSEENAKLLGLSVILYLQDHDESYPSMRSPGATRPEVLPYVKSEPGYKALVADDSFQFNPALSGAAMMAVKNPANTVLFYSKTADSFGYRTVGFTDGHENIVSASEWKALPAGAFKP